MQVEPAQIVAQQTILKVLGFYHGTLDGIWGPLTIKAKKLYESSPLFTPGIPNSGLPFGSRPPYPVGVSMVKGVLHHPAMVAVAEKQMAPTGKAEVVSSVPVAPLLQGQGKAARAQ